MKTINIRELVQTVLRNHPRDCVFAPDAEDYVVAQIEKYATDPGSFIDVCEKALSEVELYCPHEGIDKREEYYKGKALEGWVEWSRQENEYENIRGV